MATAPPAHRSGDSPVRFPRYQRGYLSANKQLAEQILALAPEVGYERHAIARALNISYNKVDNVIRRDCHAEWTDQKKVWDAAQGVESKLSRQFTDVLNVPVAKYADPIPLKPKRDGGKWKTAVIYGDTHFPFQDDAALQVIQGIIKDAKPHLIVHLGDLVDCYQGLSKYSTDPTRLHSLQDEIDAARAHLHHISQLAPDAEKLLLGGNHEDRLRKTIWDLPGRYRALTQLRVFQHSMTWPVLLELESIGWDWADYRAQPVIGKIPKLLLKHGDTVRKWAGATGLAEWQKHAKSGVSGHTHRLGTFYHRDLNGSHVWHEVGCTCTLNPEYVRQPDWTHGALVVTYSDDWFHVATVYIENGRAVWRQKEYAA